MPMRFVWKTYLWLTGWKVGPSFPHPVKKCVVIVGPHTSNWDFVIGIAVRSVAHLSHARFLGKAALFRPPFGWVFRKLGGYPVDRSQHNNMVDEVVGLFQTQDPFMLVLSPEGTRKKVDRLRTGFYHIAHKAGVPIVMAAMDYRKKQVSFSQPFYTTENESADMAKILSFYVDVEGKNPSQGLSHVTIH